MDAAAEFGAVMTEMAKRVEVKIGERMKSPGGLSIKQRTKSTFENLRDLRIRLPLRHRSFMGMCMSLVSTHSRQTLQEINNQVGPIRHIVQDSHERIQVFPL